MYDKPCSFNRLCLLLLVAPNRIVDTFALVGLEKTMRVRQDPCFALTFVLVAATAIQVDVIACRDTHISPDRETILLLSHSAEAARINGLDLSGSRDGDTVESRDSIPE